MRDWFYKGKAWVACRQGYLDSRDDLLCDRCKARGDIVPGQIVHHKTHLDDINVHDPNVALNWDNLEYLCQDCHNREHFAEELGAPRVMFDEMGRVIPIPPSEK